MPTRIAHFSSDGWPPSAPGVYVEVQALVSVSPGRKDATLPLRWVGVDTTGIVAAARPILDAIAGYKTIAEECAAEALWLVVVADGQSQTSIVATPVLPGLRDEMRKLSDRARAKGRPFFDRVIFLAAGYWPPDSIRDLALQDPVEMTFWAFDLL